MSNRRNHPANRFGCKPSEDVCLEHDLPLECRHGCYKALEHKCKFKDSDDYTPAIPIEERKL